MKVKRQRDDFVVRENSSLPLGGGDYFAYRLNKSGIGTPEAIRAIRSTWNLSGSQIAHAGLKDRHAVTSQVITIRNGPDHGMEHEYFSLEPLGRSRRHTAAQDIESNSFQIVVRDLDPASANSIQQRLKVTQGRTPNYFDDQRFGSVGYNGQFVAEAWCKKDYERAIRLALVEGNKHDGPEDREQKSIVREHWGDWVYCKQALERSHLRSIITYLVDHPSGFKKAAGLIRRDLRSLYVAAFQSRLWNDIACKRVNQLVPDDKLHAVEGAGGQLLFFKHDEVLNDVDFAALGEEQFPLPSGRRADWPSHIRSLLDEALKPFELEPYQLRFAYPRDVFFARAQRDLWLMPLDLEFSELPDAFSRSNRVALDLRFRLKAGQYATMFLRSLESAS